MICLRDLGASIQIDGNKGFLIMGWHGSVYLLMSLHVLHLKKQKIKQLRNL